MLFDLNRYHNRMAPLRFAKNYNFFKLQTRLLGLHKIWKYRMWYVGEKVVMLIKRGMLPKQTIDITYSHNGQSKNVTRNWKLKQNKQTEGANALVYFYLLPTPPTIYGQILLLWGIFVGRMVSCG